MLDDVEPQGIPQSDTTPVSRYRIRSLKPGWRIIFNGAEALVPEMAGMQLVAYLLKNPPQQPMHILELEERINPGPPVHSIGAMETESDGLILTDRLKELNLGMDDEQIRHALMEALHALEEQINNPSASSGSIMMLEKQADDIRAFLKQGLPSHRSEVSRTYDRVRKQIDRILLKLRSPGKQHDTASPVLAAFADHLEEHLVKPSRRYSDTRRSRVRAGVAQTFTYEPPPGIVWTD